MKDLYKRFYTQKEVESYEISKLESLLESGRKYPFNRHSGGYSILVPMIATTTLFVGGIYAETKDNTLLYNVYSILSQTLGDFLKVMGLWGLF